MRLWHVELLPYLPDLQFKGQLREIIAMLRNWKNGDSLGNLLVNLALDYPKSHLTEYFKIYYSEYERRYNKKINKKFLDEFIEFADSGFTENNIFKNWHNKEYLRICMANLYEKYAYAVGKTKITDKDWNTLILGYKKITGEEYMI